MMQREIAIIHPYQGGFGIIGKQYCAYTTADVDEASLTDDKVFSYTDANWRDKLTAVNGVPITYDAIGNPLSDGTWAYIWQNGRQLAAMQKLDGTESLQFEYNADGLRTKKTSTTTGTTEYIWHGTTLVHVNKGNDEIHIFYNEQSRPATLCYNGIYYAYVLNLQGDVIAICDQDGNAVVSYTYDAWGKQLACGGTMCGTLGAVNPLRYRGYTYDEETILHYLRSRYYSSNKLRFLSSDILIKHNLFSYCDNMPILNIDDTGYEYIHCNEIAHMYERISLYNGGVKDSEAFILKAGKKLGKPYEQCVCATLIDYAADQKNPSVGMSYMMRNHALVWGSIDEIGYENLERGIIVAKLVYYDGKPYTGGEYDV